MQIQSSSAANAAAGNIAQAASKDRVTAGAADAAHISANASVERLARSEAASADRDAQGGGQGLGEHGGGEPDGEPNSNHSYASHHLPARSSDPPGELDIVG